MTMYNGLVAGSRAPPEHHGHIDHCFRYLRQSIMCCGDVALEGQDPDNPDPGTDGTGAAHLCKDYGQIISWAEARRLNERKEI